MITRKNLRNHHELYWLHVYRVLTEVVYLPQLEALQFCRSMKRYYFFNPSRHCYIKQAEIYGFGYFFSNNYSFWKKGMYRNYISRQYVIKIAWLKRHREALDRIESEVWGDKVSNYPDRIW